MIDKVIFKKGDFLRSTIYPIIFILVSLMIVQPLPGQSNPENSITFKTGQNWEYVHNGTQISYSDRSKRKNTSPAIKQAGFKRNHTFNPPLKSKNSTSESVSTQWEKMPGPYGGTIRQFYNFDNILYATSDRNIFVFENSAWKSLQFEEILCNLIYSLYRYDSGRLLAGTDFGFYYSENEGETWHRVGFFNDRIRILVRSFYETEEGEVLLSTSDGIYKSNSSGTEFELLALEGMAVNSITIDSEKTIWATTNSGVLKAEYGEFNWQWMNLDNTYYLKIIADSEDVIYTFSRTKVWKSNDSGESWWMLEGSHFSDIVLDADENLIITSHNQLVSSQQETIKWVSRNTKYFITTAYPVSGSKILVGLLGNGANKYDTDANTFSFFNNGLNVSTIRGLASLGNGVLLASTDADSIYRSQDNGLSWERNIGVWATYMKSIKNGEVYARAGNDIIKSEDFGKTWKNLIIKGNSNSIVSFDVSNDGKTIYAGTTRGEIYASHDSGESFLQTHEGTGSYADAVKIINDNTLLMTSDSLYFSNDSGYTFTAIDDSLLGSINHFAIDNLGYIYLGSSNGIFKSTFGLKWRLVSENLANVDYLETDKHQNVYAALSDGSVYFSNNHGESWEMIAESIPNTFFWNFTISQDGYIFFGSQDKGLYRQEIDIRKREINEISILQNFPNPFNIYTKFEYEVPKQTFVELEIYDLLGRKVKTLVAGYKDQGKHVAIWKAERYASGVYLYKIRVGTKTKIGKMTLIK